MSSENIYQAPNSDVSSEGDTQYEFAGFWVRSGATLIDTIIVLAFTVPLLMTIYGADYWFSERVVSGVWDIIINYVLPAVLVFIFWSYKSATPGKMVFGLKIISLGTQEKLSGGQMVGRYLGYYISTIVLMLGFIWVAFDSRKQGWHDKLANTAVVKVKR